MGRFERHEELGERVWLAQDLYWERSVVLKQGPVADLRREVELLLELDHPNVRGMRAASLSPDSPWVAFEAVQGRPLDAALRSRPAQAERLAIDVLRALVHMHARSIVHGDLKPQNILVAKRGAKVIDLGMSGRQGERPRGGTPGFIAPELAGGGSLHVSNDLFAVGKIFGDHVPALKSCASNDPAARPASADVVLAALGHEARAADRRAPWTPRLPADVSSAIGRFDGATVLVHLPHHRCNDEWIRRAAQPFWIDGRSVVDGIGSTSTFAALAEALEVPPGAIAAASVAATRKGWPLLLNATGADEDDEAALVTAARSLAALRQGCLVVFGADERLQSKLADEGAQVEAVAPWDRTAIAEVAGAYGIDDDARVEALTQASEGEPVFAMRLMQAFAEEPELVAADLRERMRELKLVEPSVAAADPIAAAREALERGAPRRALRLMGSTAPVSLKADALAAAGRMAEALDLETAPRSPERKLQRGVWLERLGRWKEARAEMSSLMKAQSAVAPKAARIAAIAAREQGEHEAATAIIKQALGSAVDPIDRAELLLVESDLAVASGNAVEAESLARRAESLGGSDGLLARARARAAAATAMAGRWEEARGDYQTALQHAQSAGDIAAIPAYLMNVATADHACGALGQAQEGYERSATLARRLGRRGLVAAALTNLAGLLASLGVRDEASQVLQQAKQAAQDVGAAMYAAQCSLIEAEIIGATSPERGREIALEAKRAFESVGAHRQALEAELLAAEHAQRAGHESPSLDAAKLRQAGLELRFVLLEARRAQQRGNLALAWESCRRARELATDPLQKLEALKLLEEIAKLEGRSDPSVSAEREQLRQRLADGLSPGLRQRFLEHSRVASPGIEAGPAPGLSDDARRLLMLMRRVLLESDETRVLSDALDEAVASSGAERAFLLKKKTKGRPQVVVARNLDRETIRNSRFRFSRSVAEQVLETGEAVLTASAADDPAFESARSVHEMSLRSILCVPIRSPSGIVGALYLDHRFTAGAFGPGERELVSALADLVGLALENARLHAAAKKRTEELEEAERIAREQSTRSALEVARLAAKLEQGK